MWRELFFALLLCASNVLIHALGSYGLFLWLTHVLRKHPIPNMLQAWVMIIRTVVFLLALHAAEVAVWAHFYMVRGCFSDLETAYYFSLTSYTTLGFGDVVLPRPWRILGGCEAMIGVLMFGWSTATLVGLFHHLQDVRLQTHPSPGPQ
jgi:hypothetical protein